MAMEPCPECRSLMSDRAPTCLNCGYPIAPDRDRRVQHGHTIRNPRWSGLVLYGTFASVLMLVAISLWQL